VRASSALSEIFGQAVMRSPSVFNFFLPSNLLSNDSDLLAPEMQIMTEANIASIHNAFHQQIYTYNNQNTDGWNAATRINVDKAVELASDTEELLDYLSKLLLSSGLAIEQRQILSNHLNTFNNAETKALEAIFLIVASPAFMVQE